MQLIAVRVQRAQRETTRSHSLEQALTCAAARDEFGKVGVRRLGPVPGRDLDRVQAKFDGQPKASERGRFPTESVINPSCTANPPLSSIRPHGGLDTLTLNDNTTDNTTKAPRESQSGDAVVTPAKESSA